MRRKFRRQALESLSEPSPTREGLSFYMRGPNLDPKAPTPSGPPPITYDDLNENNSPDKERIIREESDA